MYRNTDTILRSFEEHTVMAQYHAHFTDEELNKIEADFMKQLDPKHLQELTPMFLRAGNVDDVTKILMAIKVRAERCTIPIWSRPFYTLCRNVICIATMSHAAHTVRRSARGV